MEMAWLKMTGKALKASAVSHIAESTVINCMRT